METVSYSELPSMAATLCFYENSFGPYHPHTLHLTTTVAIAYGQHGESEFAIRLLERVLRDVHRISVRNSDLRLRAMLALRDLWLERGDLPKAASAQKEVIACQSDVLGSDHPETSASRNYLATLLFDAAA